MDSSSSTYHQKRGHAFFGTQRRKVIYHNIHCVQKKTLRQSNQLE